MSVAVRLARALEPPFFFVAYLALVNTFLAITHGPLDPIVREEFATAYVDYLSVHMFHMAVQLKPGIAQLVQMFMAMHMQGPAPTPSSVPVYVTDSDASCSDTSE